MLVLLAIGVLLVSLLVVAVWRPWLGLLLLLALMSFNSVVADVLAPSIGLSETARTMLAGWHDALALGVIIAAAFRWVRHPPLRLTAFEVAAAILMGCGVISLLVAPHLVTGLYAYRTLYEPVALAVAIVVLARVDGLPVRLPSRAALAIVLSGAASALFAVWQVYGGGIGYVTKYFTAPDGRLPSAYLPRSCPSRGRLGLSIRPTSSAPFWRSRSSWWRPPLSFRCQRRPAPGGQRRWGSRCSCPSHGARGSHWPSRWLP
jgi:hypothetical protein